MDQTKTVQVIIPLFGNVSLWKERVERAANSVVNQKNVGMQFHVTISVSDNLQYARNSPAFGSKMDSIIFLDADDTLDENYISEMLKMEGDIISPAAHRHYENSRIDKEQYWYNPIPLIQRNYIVIGAMIKTELFKRLGGFSDLPMLEDWDMWLRAEELGATFCHCPKAIYQIHVNEEGRNKNQMEYYQTVLNEAKKRRGII